MNRFIDHLDTNGNYIRIYGQSADIKIHWIKEHSGEDKTLGTEFKSMITIGLGMTKCLNDWQPLDENSITKLLYHEMGHAFGYRHSSDPNNIMYKLMEPKLAIDYDNTLTIDEGSLSSIPLCDGGTFQYSASVTNSKSNGFDLLYLVRILYIYPIVFLFCKFLY